VVGLELDEEGSWIRIAGRKRVELEGKPGHRDLSLFERHGGTVRTEATASRRIVKEPRIAGQKSPAIHALACVTAMCWVLRLGQVGGEREVINGSIDRRFQGKTDRVSLQAVRRGDPSAPGPADIAEFNADRVRDQRTGQPVYIKIGRPGSMTELSPGALDPSSSQDGVGWCRTFSADSGPRHGAKRCRKQGGAHAEEDPELAQASSKGFTRIP
jgi:hypothetical protein